MRFSRKWLQEYVGLTVSTEQLADDLTMLGLEIESIEEPGKDIDQVYIGKILSIEAHPKADRIVVCKTDVGGPEPLQICCGAKNMQVGDKVPTAVSGATLPGGFAIGTRKMRGVESQGMMCSAKELGLGDDHAGLMIVDASTPVGSDAKELLGLDDTIFEIEVTPNRGDWASMLGIARELAARYALQMCKPSVAIEASGGAASDFASLRVDAPDLCPLYLGRVLLDVTIGPSPLWLANRLIAAGMRPINTIVDVTNFVMLETGQPLHAFDLDQIGDHTVVVRRAQTDEPMRTLDDQARTLDSEMLVIADAQHPQCIAGVMGGATSEVSDSTKRIFLESAVFDARSVRRTSRTLGLISESSQRFQRGADPEMVPFALDRAAKLMHELAGARVCDGVLEARAAIPAKAPVTLSFARTDALVGEPILPDDQCGYLERLGFECAERGRTSATFHVPSWRYDVRDDVDLIEEIVRLYGYNTVAPTLPRVRPSSTVLGEPERRMRQLSHQLVAMGLTEWIHWTFSAADDPLGKATTGTAPVPLQNPLSEKQANMRTSLLPGLLTTTAYNLNRGAARIAAFEIGPVYGMATGESATGVVQSTRLAIVLAGQVEAKHWSAPARDANFFDLKGLLEAVAAATIGTPLATTATTDAVYVVGQQAEASIAGHALGHFGRISPKLAAAYEIEKPVYAAEIDLDALIVAARPHAQFETIPNFPASLRDLAVVVDAAIPAADLATTAQKAGGELLRGVDIFDIYTGSPVPEHQKSVALSLAFQANDRTLTDDDTQGAIEAILHALSDAHGAAVR